MISHNRIKQILSLKTKKGRNKEKLFIIEGSRCVQSFINSSNLVKEIFMNKDFAIINKKMLQLCDKQNIVYSVVPDKDMKNLSDTKTPSGIIGICMFKSLPSLNYDSKRWLYLYEISEEDKQIHLTVYEIGYESGATEIFHGTPEELLTKLELDYA